MSAGTAAPVGSFRIEAIDGSDYRLVRTLRTRRPDRRRQVRQLAACGCTSGAPATLATCAHALGEGKARASPSGILWSSSGLNGGTPRQAGTVRSGPPMRTTTRDPASQSIWAKRFASADGMRLAVSAIGNPVAAATITQSAGSLCGPIRLDRTTEGQGRHDGRRGSIHFVQKQKSRTADDSSSAIKSGCTIGRRPRQCGEVPAHRRIRDWTGGRQLACGRRPWRRPPPMSDMPMPCAHPKGRGDVRQNESGQTD